MRRLYRTCAFWLAAIIAASAFIFTGIKASRAYASIVFEPVSSLGAGFGANTGINNLNICIYYPARAEVITYPVARGDQGKTLQVPIDVQLDAVQVVIGGDKSDFSSGTDFKNRTRVRVIVVDQNNTTKYDQYLTTDRTPVDVGSYWLLLYSTPSLRGLGPIRGTWTIKVDYEVYV